MLESLNCTGDWTKWIECGEDPEADWDQKDEGHLYRGGILMMNPLVGIWSCRNPTGGPWRPPTPVAFVSGPFLSNSLRNFL